MRRNVGFASLAILSACGGGGGGGGGGPPPVQNQAPNFTSGGAASIVENRSDAYQATATDPEGSALTFTITGGADAARFAISTSGALSFVAPPDFDLALDSDANNIYLVEISVSDGQASRSLPLQVTVTNDREGIAVRRVATGFTQPTYVAPIPGDSRVFVAERGGTIFLLDPATGMRTPFLDVTSRNGVRDFSSDGERGLLGIAAPPNYAATRSLFVFLTVADGDIEIREYMRAGDPGAPLPYRILRIEHSQNNNHNGGWLGFGPDGKLYAAVGDGGGAGDPAGNAQNLNSHLGKILRFSSSSCDPFPGATVPEFPIRWCADPANPFAKTAGPAGAVFAYGLRNPFRASFFGDTLLIGDVGQDSVEEIDLIRTSTPGLNFGWNFREGSRPFAGTAPAGLTEPVSEYLHGSGPRQGASIIGGYVYRGPATALRGRYIFADFVSRNLWSVPADQLVPGQILASSRYERRNDDFTADAGTIDQPVSFGEDSAGNLYIVDFDGEIYMVGGA